MFFGHYFAAATALAFFAIAPAVHAEQVHSDEFKFSVETPFQTRTEHKTDVTDNGIPFDSYRWKASDDQTAWFIFVNDYHGDMLSDQESNLTEAFATNGTLTSKRAITVDGHKGVDMTGVTPQGLAVRDRVIQVGNRLYQQIYVGPGGSAESPAVSAYVNSFHISE